MAKNAVAQPNIYDMAKETQKMAMNHTKLLLEQYRKLRGTYGFDGKTVMENVMKTWPDWTHEFFRMFGEWLEKQMKFFEDNIESAVDDYVKAISDLKFTAPSINKYPLLVNEHTKLWIENYRKMREQREKMSRDSFEAVKRTLPAAFHPMMDNAYEWVVEQNKRMEEDIIERIKEYSKNASLDDD